MVVTEQVKKPTPIVNEALDYCPGEFKTLSDALDYAAQGETGFNFYSPRGVLDIVLPYRQLRELAVNTGRRLLKSGLKRGDRVGVVAETTPEFMAVFFGCQYAGLIPCPLPYSMYIGGREAYVTRLKGMMKSADITAAIASDGLIDQVSEAAGATGTTIAMSHSDLAKVEASEIDLYPFTSDDAAYIQYSSGSTSDPKGVLITQRSATVNINGIINHGVVLTRGDRSFSWLPLYHDMGLVGFCLTPVMCQMSNDFLATSAFARRPLLWCKIMSDNHSTITFSPSFGYDLASRRVNGSAGDYDLSSLRVAGIGGDMIRADVLDAFSKTFRAAGFKSNTFMASYGMAESTLAVSFASIERQYDVDLVDRAHIKSSRKAVMVDQSKPVSEERSRSFILCGKPLPGHAMEVRDDNGAVLDEREIGHILISGPSLMSGYFNNDGATDEVLDDDGWLKTGDMGYLLNGEIVITGRSKDLILHNGRNIWPQDIEWAVEKISPLRNGDAAAFAIETDAGDETVVVLVQCRMHREDECEALHRQISAVVHQQTGVECNVVLVPPRSLPFTSSGKLSRASAKLRYLSGEIAEISRKIVSDQLGISQVSVAQGAAK